MRSYIIKLRPKGSCPPRKPLSKIFWSGLGSFIGIASIALISVNPHLQDSLFLIGSFGASAVLVYGAPDAVFSQPRNLIGGHVVSAIVGVLAQKAMVYFDLPIWFAAAVAVSLSIVLMHMTRTLHPPGGATALIAVIGSQSVQELSWYYIIQPVFVGALILLAFAMLVNNLSQNPKRHYPVYWY